jgi:hypothetical protein
MCDELHGRRAGKLMAQDRLLDWRGLDGWGLFAERGDGGAIPTTMLTVECGRGGFEGNTGVKPTGSLLTNGMGA